MVPSSGVPGRFSSVVEFPFVGSHAEAALITNRIAALPSHDGLGRVVDGDAAGARCSAVGGPWSDKMARRARSYARDAASLAPVPGSSSRRGPYRKAAAMARGRTVARETTATATGVSLADDGGRDGSMADDCEEQARPLPYVRPSRRAAKVASDKRDPMTDALVPFLHRTCGLPASSTLASRQSSVTVGLVTHAETRSHAVVLRWGPGKNGAAVLWVSRRGGLLCSCFLGTQNAMFLSASSRSTACKHVKAMEKALEAADIPWDVLKERLRMPANTKDFATPRMHGSTLLWIVLYRGVFSAVFISASNVAVCIAPGCRRFRGRCGHVKVARPAHAEHVVKSGSDKAAARHRAAAVGAKVNDEPRAFINAENEDDGIEKMEGDTVRAKTDVEVRNLARRQPRNMLPCTGEIAQGDAWARTADWHSIFKQRAVGAVAGRKDALRKLSEVLAIYIGIGRMVDTRLPLIEPSCASCGQRHDRQPVRKEPALLHTQHATAPPLRVCLLSLRIARLSSLMFPCTDVVSYSLFTSNHF